LYSVNLTGTIPGLAHFLARDFCGATKMPHYTSRSGRFLAVAVFSLAAGIATGAMAKKGR
jgi:hypothetical protein